MMPEKQNLNGSCLRFLKNLLTFFRLQRSYCEFGFLPPETKSCIAEIEKILVPVKLHLEYIQKKRK